MTSVLILGANGQLARHATRKLLASTDVKLTLYLRRPSRLTNPDLTRARIIEGDVLDTAALTSAMRDVVFASLAGDLKRQTESIVRAMHEAGVKRLVPAIRR